MKAEGRDPARAGSSSSAETQALFSAQEVGPVCPEAFREGGGRRSQERRAPSGVQEGRPGLGATPTVAAAQAFFLDSYTKKLEKYIVHSKYSQMIVAAVLTILLKV